jgi:PPK2 family polyphosphate:nucleotide phosphotransferase
MIKPKQLRRLLDRYRVTDGRGFKLADHDPEDTGGKLVDREDGAALLAAGIARLSELQELLYPQADWALLCIFQAIDAAGKDGTIKHVMSGVNPQGVVVTAFKAPGPDELAHDFLWRVSRAMPARGHIGIFNRSHYEEVLVVRVHPDLLERQGIPERLRGRKIWDHRLADIAAWEAYQARQGTVMLKFFLHVSKAEQKRRFFERLDDPDKNWKFNAGDIAERARWDAYMHAYEQAIRATAAPHAPWYVVPADEKWFTRLVVVSAMIEALENLKLKPPQAPPELRAELARMRATLEAE